MRTVKIFASLLPRFLVFELCRLSTLVATGERVANTDFDVVGVLERMSFFLAIIERTWDTTYRVTRCHDSRRIQES